jgi:hypothetical protein
MLWPTRPILTVPNTPHGGRHNRLRRSFRPCLPGHPAVSRALAEQLRPPESGKNATSDGTKQPLLQALPGIFQTPVRIGVAGLGSAGRVSAGRSTLRS